MGANLRESLTDMDNNFVVQRRDRSQSNEKFDLPPLPDFYDNRDLAHYKDDVNENYKSTGSNFTKNIFSNLAADGDEFQFEIELKEEESPDHLDLDLAMEEDEDIDLERDPVDLHANYNSIFDKIEQEDKDEIVLTLNEPKDLAMSLDEIENDFPGI